jgi:hypothetical protein
VLVNCRYGGWGRDWRRTTGATGAYCAVRRVGLVTADIAYAGIVQALVAKVLAVQVLDAPEAAGCNGGLLGAFGDGNGRGHGGLRERSEEAGDEGHAREYRDEGGKEDETPRYRRRCRVSRAARLKLWWGGSGFLEGYPRLRQTGRNCATCRCGLILGLLVGGLM